jgi:hypothetical protein
MLQSIKDKLKKKTSPSDKKDIIVQASVPTPSPTTPCKTCKNLISEGEFCSRECAVEYKKSVEKSEKDKKEEDDKKSEKGDRKNGDKEKKDNKKRMNEEENDDSDDKEEEIIDDKDDEEEEEQKQFDKQRKRLLWNTKFIEETRLSKRKINNSYYIHVVPARMYIKIKNWYGNRDLDPEHVELLKNVIYNQIKEGKTNSINWCGRTVVVKDKKNNLYLIEGGHRRLAIKELLEEDDTLEMEFEVHLYEVDDVSNDEEISKLFYSINNQKAVSAEDHPENKINAVLEKLKTKFNKEKSGVIAEIIGDNVMKPGIKSKVFVSNAKEYELSKCGTADKIYEEICEYNNNRRKYYTKLYEEEKLFKMYKNITEKNWNRVKKHRFYLGLESNYEWMDDIARKLRK